MAQPITQTTLDQLFANNLITKQHITHFFGEPESSKKDKNLASRTFLHTKLFCTQNFIINLMILAKFILRLMIIIN